MMTISGNDVLPFVSPLLRPTLIHTCVVDGGGIIQGCIAERRRQRFAKGAADMIAY